MIDGAPARGTRGSILTVFSSKGGIGATSVAANLGVALAARGLRTVLVDLTFQLGDLGLMFNERGHTPITQAWRNGTLDDSALRSVISAHETGVSLITVATSPESAKEITDKQILELCTVLRRMFDVVIIDLGRSLDERSHSVLQDSDFIALMTALDVPAIRNTDRCLEILGRMGVDPKRIQLILNRFTETGRLTLSDMEKALGRKVFWTIPNDFEPMSLGIDAGTPAIVEAPRSKLAQNFRELAERFHQALAAHSVPTETTTS